MALVQGLAIPRLQSRALARTLDADLASLLWQQLRHMRRQVPTAQRVCDRSGAAAPASGLQRRRRVGTIVPVFGGSGTRARAGLFEHQWQRRLLTRTWSMVEGLSISENQATGYPDHVLFPDRRCGIFALIDWSWSCIKKIECSLPSLAGLNEIPALSGKLPFNSPRRHDQSKFHVDLQSVFRGRSTSSLPRVKRWQSTLLDSQEECRRGED